MITSRSMVKTHLDSFRKNRPSDAQLVKTLPCIHFTLKDSAIKGTLRQNENLLTYGTYETKSIMMVFLILK